MSGRAGGEGAGRGGGAGTRARTGLHEGIYEVFARKRRGDPLRHIGYIDAPGDELARVYAWKTYDEENWFEMCVVPRGAVIPVNRSDGPWAANRPGAGGGGAGRGGGGDAA